MSREQHADVRAPIRVDEVVVHELSRGAVAHHDAGAKAQCQRHGGDGCEGESPARDRWTDARCWDHIADEAIPAARNRLNHAGVGTERNTDLTNREIDVLVELDDAIGPQACANLLARYQLSGVLDQQHEELRGLRLQRAALDSPAEDAALRIEHVRSESDERGHETIIR